ncbi:MAG: phosphodiester glycosidase family protein [Candidatus Limivivens sp.]|nr:phosphodiester glycosidase family protein [Candidatus Limivivens sp.]
MIKGKKGNFGLLAVLLALFLAFLAPAAAEAAKTGWVKSGNTYYYYLENGKKAKSRWIGDYYVTKTGARAKNTWITTDGKRYFVGEDGKWIPNFKGGWQKIQGKWYYYTKSGKKKTGWITCKNQRYYLDANGVMLTKWQTIKKKTYYFDKKGNLKKSSWVKRGSWYYYADSSGRVNLSERMNTNSLSTATKIRYESSTLRVELNKYQKYGANYWVARVRIKDPSQLKTPLSYGSYGGTRERTSHVVSKNNGIIGINGSAFSYETGKPGPDAVMIKNGKIYNKALGTSYSLMAVKWDGTMYNPKQGLTAKQLLNQGVKATFNFGPVLIKNGKAQPIDYENFSLTAYKDPRTAVGMVKKGEYVLLVADGRNAGGSSGLNQKEMISILKGYGCKFAYNLDGGGSSTLVYKGQVLNNPSDGKERACGDFLYFTD